MRSAHSATIDSSGEKHATKRGATSQTSKTEQEPTDTPAMFIYVQPNITANRIASLGS